MKSDLELDFESQTPVDFSDDILEQSLRDIANDEDGKFTYEHVYEELRRRSQERQTDAIVSLTRRIVFLTYVASISAAVSALAAIVALFKG